VSKAFRSSAWLFRHGDRVEADVSARYWLDGEIEVRSSSTGAMSGLLLKVQSKAVTAFAQQGDKSPRVLAEEILALTKVCPSPCAWRRDVGKILKYAGPNGVVQRNTASTCETESDTPALRVLTVIHTTALWASFP
jgi:hypothetical protein